MRNKGWGRLKAAAMVGLLVSRVDGSCDRVSSSGHLIIAANETDIVESAFEGCTNLTSVVFEGPSSLTRIYRGAFKDCTGLRSINLPDTLNKIFTDAFRGTGLQEVTIPDSVERIKHHAFYECAELHSVYISDSVVAIDNDAFARCPSLGSGHVSIPSRVSYGPDVFQGCNCTTEGLYSPGAVFTNCEYTFALASATTVLEYSPQLPMIVARSSRAERFEVQSNSSILAPGTYRSVPYGDPGSLVGVVEFGYNSSGLDGAIVFNSQDGSFVITPTALQPGSYVMDFTAKLYAPTLLGTHDHSEIVVRSWVFTVSGEFALASNMTFTERPTLENLTILPTTVALERSIGFAPPRNATELRSHFVNLEDASDITFRLQMDERMASDYVGHFLVDSASGYIAVNPMGTVAYDATLLYTAISSSGGEALIYNWTVQVRQHDTDNPTNGPQNKGCSVNSNVVDTIPFDGAFSCTCLRNYRGPNCDDPPPLLVEGEQFMYPLPVPGVVHALYNRTHWATSQTYKLLGYNLTSATADGNDKIADVTYSLNWIGRAAEHEVTQEIFIAPSSGVIQFVAPSVASEENGTFVGQLQAAVPDTTPFIIANISFFFLESDTAEVSNGPNGEDCARVEQRVDVTEFDGSFTCDCSKVADAKDANCNEAADSAASNDVAIYVAISLAVLVLVIGLFLIRARRRMLKARYEPEDLDKIQADLLTALGMEGTFDIGPEQIGFRIVFDRAVPIDTIGKDVHRRSLTTKVSPFLASLAATLAGADKRVKWDEGQFSIDISQVCVVVPKLTGSHSPERVLSSIQKLIGKKQFVVSGAVAIEAGIQIPKQVPREIRRTAVERIAMLGEGEYGEVFKASLSERSLPSFLVAAKGIKPGAAGSTDAAALREELLKEATLMAMLSHRNVIHLIGVVTIPRNVPALIVLEYCENGSLLDFVRKDDLSKQMLLSLIADTASGMEYLAACRIVHRDLACRNVLLDSALTAKISDFGMSIAMASDEGAKEYVRIKGNMPIRWCAPEVLQEGKYSVASDIFAFGILVYEVMTRGDVPYGNITRLVDVAEWIKAGRTISKPDDCPIAVYDSLMAPCWLRDPAARPQFAELHSAALDLGGSQSYDVSAADGVWNRLRELHPLVYFETMPGRSFLGLSVEHICSVLYPNVADATRPPWRDRRGNEVSDPILATMSHAVEAYVKPVTAERECPRDGNLGCAYVDSVDEKNHVGPCTSLLSYSWQYCVKDIGEALKLWCEGFSRDLGQTYIWICALCLNQHRIKKDLTPEELAAEFGPRVEAIGRITPMFDVWQATGYVSRAWCLYELFTAISKRDTVAINIIMTPQQREAFLLSIQNWGYSGIDQVVESIQAENTTASRKADLEAIRGIVCSMPGGFDALNATVKQHLTLWFEAQGAVRSAARAHYAAPHYAAPHYEHGKGSAYGRFDQRQSRGTSAAPKEATRVGTSRPRPPRSGKVAPLLAGEAVTTRSKHAIPHSASSLPSQLHSASKLVEAEYVSGQQALTQEYDFAFERSQTNLTEILAQRVGDKISAKGTKRERTQRRGSLTHV